MTIPWSMRFDMRVPPFATVRCPEMYRGALELAAYADEHGCWSINFTEHHGSADGYLPDGLTLAAAFAAVTRKVRLGLRALILPLHDPISTAERTLLVDQISNGRVDVVVGAGYRPFEYEMFGLDIGDRVALMEEKLPVYLAALSGEEFSYGGRTIRVTPKPVQYPRPQVLLGGSTSAVARRAARLADGFAPAIRAPDPALIQAYYDECDRLERPRGLVVGDRGLAPDVFVAPDPDLAWQRLGPYLLHETNAYAQWAAESGNFEHNFRAVDSVDGLRGLKAQAIMTVAECVAYAGERGSVGLHPMAGGIPPELALESLRLFVEEVLPRVQ